MKSGSDILFPFVSVIVSMKNEEEFIGKCINSIIQQDYPKDKFEIIIIDGGSRDNSVTIAKNLVKRYSNIRLFYDLRTLNLPEALNFGINKAKGEILIKVDAHGYVATDFLKMNVKYLYSDNNIKCIGGPIRPLTETIIANSNVYARSSVFGVGKSIYSINEKPQFVDTVQCGSYKKKVFEEIGLFDESLQFGEDEEINWRIIKAGYKIFLTPEVKFFYYPRKSFGGLFKQYYNYGKARVKVIRKHPDFLKIKHIIPSAFILSLIGSGILTIFNISFYWLFLGIVGSYLLSSLIFSALISHRKGWQYFGLLPFSFASLHFGYGIGFLTGICDFVIYKKCRKE